MKGSGGDAEQCVDELALAHHAADLRITEGSGEDADCGAKKIRPNKRKHFGYNCFERSVRQANAKRASERQLGS